MDGRSRVVSKDLMDTVEWAMPGLMEALVGDDVVSFQPDDEGEEQGAEDATRYVTHYVFEKNDGFTVLYEAIKSCLIQRMGVVKVYYEVETEERQERYVGVSQAEIEALQADNGVEIVEQTEMEPAIGPDGQPVPAFEVIVRRSHDKPRFCVDGVPQEEIRIAKDTRRLARCRFIAHEVKRSYGDLLAEGWPKAELDRMAADDSNDGEMAARHAYDNSDPGNPVDESQREITVTEAYGLFDLEGEGKLEYRRILKGGTYIHENEVVDDHPFAVFSPILMPYKLLGIGFFDLVEDLQRIKTALTRQVLDSAYLSNNPMKEVVTGQVDLDDLMNPRAGGIIRVKAPGMVNPHVTPFLGEAGMAVIGHVDQVRDQRTGVTETNSALNAESLARGQVGSEGVQSLMQAGAQRQKLIARVLAETGLKRIYQLMLKLVTQYQDRPEQMKVNGRWLSIDPREWRNGYRTTVKVGLGTADKARELANLQLIGEAQEKLLAVGLVQPQNLYHTATMLARAMGYRNPDDFFSPPNPNPPPQPPPIELQIEQMRQQGQQALAQLKGQVDVQVAQMTQAAQDTQAQRETELEAARDAQKMQHEKELEAFKAQLAADLEREKAMIQQQTAIATARINAEAKIASAETMGAKDASNAREDVAYQEARE